jgi:superfamily I DNA/RNA helicase
LGRIAGTFTDSLARPTGDEQKAAKTTAFDLQGIPAHTGLEFRAVAVMACDDEVIPSQERIELVSDEVDLAGVYDTERHLLYVACTWARDHLLVSSGDAPSESLEDPRV